ncbi:MAG: hypothetical protein GY810_09875 [Aureispira sp.]|nr:hypothetical protein [Aureispira sp.]
MMLKYLLGLISLLSIVSCGKTPLYNSKWTQSAVKMDGKLTEWEKTLHQVSKQTNLLCAVANDKEYLYVAVRVPDKRIQAMVYQLGMTVWIDTMAKKRNTIGIGFPLPLTQTQMDHLGNALNKGGQKGMENAYSELAQEFELIGFVEDRLKISNLASKSMKVGANFDELGVLTMEYKIPFKQIYKRIPNFDEELSIGVKVNTPEESADNDPGLFDDTNNNNPITSNNMNNPMLGGGMGRSQLPGRQGSGAGMPRQPSSSPNFPNIWLKAKLAKE